MTTSLKMEEVGRLVSQQMVATGMTQTQLALESGLDRSKISQIVRGKIYPETSDVERIERACGLAPGSIAAAISRNGIPDN